MVSASQKRFLWSYRVEITCNSYGHLKNCREYCDFRQCLGKVRTRGPEERIPKASARPSGCWEGTGEDRRGSRNGPEGGIGGQVGCRAVGGRLLVRVHWGVDYHRSPANSGGDELVYL